MGRRQQGHCRRLGRGETSRTSAHCSWNKQSLWPLTSYLCWSLEDEKHTLRHFTGTCSVAHINAINQAMSAIYSIETALTWPNQAPVVVSCGTMYFCSFKGPEHQFPRCMHQSWYTLRPDTCKGLKSSNIKVKMVNYVWSLRCFSKCKWGLIWRRKGLLALQVQIFPVSRPAHPPRCRKLHIFWMKNRLKSSEVGVKKQQLLSGKMVFATISTHDPWVHCSWAQQAGTSRCAFFQRGQQGEPGTGKSYTEATNYRNDVYQEFYYCAEKFWLQTKFGHLFSSIF